MLKNLFVFLVLVVVVVLPATAMAVEWTGAVDSTWEYAAVPGNWTDDPELGGVYTTEARITSGEWGDPTPPNWPLIAEGNATAYGHLALRNSATLTQTGGYHVWINGSGDMAFNLYNDDWWYPGCPAATASGSDASIPATLDLTGGVHQVNGEISIGFDGYDDVSMGTDGVTPTAGGILNIGGDGIFYVQNNPWHVTGSHLLIAENSVINISENGTLRMPIELKEVVDAYLDGGTFTYLNRHADTIESMTVAPGRIVATEVDHWLFRFQDGADYVVVATDQILIPGDADQDGDVDDADATILASNWLAGDATWAMGDFNFDRAVNEKDASMLAANYGVTTPPAASVPEPSALLLLCLGLGNLVLIRRR